MNNESLLRALEGLHTVETVMEELQMSRQSALNFLGRLKKAGYVTVSGSGRRKRLYKITMRRQRPRVPGMWDILNKYNPHFQLNPWYDHQVHGKYTVEDVIVDAIETRSFRIILATLRLFAHVTDWPRLYQKAREKGSWQKVGALYDVARMFLKVRRMPGKYRKGNYRKWDFLFDRKDSTPETRFAAIRAWWKIPIPFRIGDIRKVELC